MAMSYSRTSYLLNAPPPQFLPKSYYPCPRKFSSDKHQYNARERILSIQSWRMSQKIRPGFSCAVNISAGCPSEPDKINFLHLKDKARKLWGNLPQPVQIFPWNRVGDNFIQLIMDLVLAVFKFLSIPLLAVSSLSEMSYCAHERKLLLVPFPFLIGIAVAGILNDTLLEPSPLLKDAEVPWHLIAFAVFFTLLKLIGPYYPYWGRLLIPHLANGVLWRTIWFTFLWYKRPRGTLRKGV